MPQTSSHALLAGRWNALPPPERRRLRRLVHIGRLAPDDPHHELAREYARQRLARPWSRRFWLWFPVMALMAALAAAGIHPLLLGMVLALAANALLVRRNVARTART